MSESQNTGSPTIIPASLTSEVGSSPFGPAPDQWNTFFEFMKNFLPNPSSAKNNVTLPRFNPESVGSDPVAWCSATELCLSENPLQGSGLISALSETLEGSAAQWISQAAIPGIQWPQLKELFVSRFGGQETATAVVLKIHQELPTKDESVGAFGIRLRSSLKARWRSLTVDEIINAVVLARLTHIDNRVERVALTTDIKTEVDFLSEMRGFSYTRKRPVSASDNSSAPDSKRFKPAVSVKCHFCGEIVTRTGHIAPNCTTSGSDRSGPGNNKDNGGVERRVNLCTVAAPTGILNHLEILFHVVPDEYLNENILIGREILSLGFEVNISQLNFNIGKSKVINECSKVEIINFDTVDTDVDKDDKIRLVSILKEYESSFITGFPRTHVNSGELEIRLIDPSITVQRKPYRLSVEERQIVRKRINELLEANVIHPSNSPFASPILLVKKKDGSDRLCVDYRELNKNTIADKFPLPLILDQIPRLRKAKFYISLDIASGFHQIPIHPESIERTAFVTPDGQFEFLTMPFGLKNAPSVFQRAILKALGELAYTYVVVYLDDVLVIADTIEETFERLRMCERMSLKLTSSIENLSLGIRDRTHNVEHGMATGPREGGSHTQSPPSNICNAAVYLPQNDASVTVVRMYERERHMGSHVTMSKREREHESIDCDKVISDDL
ncbi:uncharacterized protein LOC141537903 [Cotesia typhae]|uniref:uncharacterized protein LOC141537903 n=1 Tax=Cotesia typhae TaxID=2053667 RepID=UPI003D698EA8